MNLRNTTEDYQLELIRKDNPELNTLLAIYPEEQLSKLLNNKDKIGKVLRSFQKNTGVMSYVGTMFLNCDNTCPYLDICILKKNGMAPEGCSCPIEKKIAMELENDIVVSLKLDRSNPIDMELLWDLIDVKLFDMRAGGSLRNGSIAQIISKVSKDGTSLSKEIEPALEIKIKLKEIKHEIIDMFLGTPRAKKKYGMHDDRDTLEEMLLRAAKQTQVDELPK